MRFLMKVSMPVEAGNTVAKGGYDVLQKILAEVKPEAAYFVAEGGKRTGILIVNMDDPSQLPGIAEPFFLGLHASIEITPCSSLKTFFGLRNIWSITGSLKR